MVISGQKQVPEAIGTQNGYKSEKYEIHGESYIRSRLIESTTGNLSGEED
jgi:hypothetical protein